MLLDGASHRLTALSVAYRVDTSELWEIDINATKVYSGLASLDETGHHEILELRRDLILGATQYLPRAIGCCGSPVAFKHEQ